MSRAGGISCFVHRVDERIGGRVPLDCRGITRPVRVCVFNALNGCQCVFDSLFTAFATHSLDGECYCHTQVSLGHSFFAFSLNEIRIQGDFIFESIPNPAILFCLWDSRADVCETSMKPISRYSDCLPLAAEVRERFSRPDETDLEILRLFAEDGRRPYSDVAELVDLSPPAVSDRVNRLEEHGVIRRFTVDIDRSQLREGTPVLVRLVVVPGHTDAVRQTLTGLEAVEHVFTMANANIVFYATAPRNDVRGWLLSELDTDTVREFEVELVNDIDWNRNVSGTKFALTCAECGNTVTNEGVTTRLDGDLKQFCCPSCESRYTERYEELKEAA